MADAIPVASTKGKQPAEAKKDWKDGLPDAVVAAVEALGGPDNPNAKQLIAMNEALANPKPEPGKVKREIKLQSHDAIRQDF